MGENYVQTIIKDPYAMGGALFQVASLVVPELGEIGLTGDTLEGANMLSRLADGASAVLDHVSEGASVLLDSAKAGLVSKYAEVTEYLGKLSDGASSAVSEMSGRISDGLSALKENIRNIELPTLQPEYAGIGSFGGKTVGDGAGSFSGKLDVLSTDEARNAVEKYISNGQVDVNGLKEEIPDHIPNSFKPTDRISNGEKYEFDLSDGNKSILKWHDPDKEVTIRFPKSPSDKVPTAQLKVGNKFLKDDGTWTRNGNSAGTHIPLKGN